VSKRIYVGSLPYSATEEQIEALFGEHGKVIDCQVITDRFSGQAKGFGFVEMENDAEADNAIAAHGLRADKNCLHCRAATRTIPHKDNNSKHEPESQVKVFDVPIAN